jgi:hypothetical protein
MSTLQVANVYLESTGNNRIQYAGSNTISIYTASNQRISVNSAVMSVAAPISFTVPGASSSTSAALKGVTTYAAGSGTTTLTSTSTQYHRFTGDIGQTIVLPATSTLTTGWSFYIVNNNTNPYVSLDIQTATGALLITVPANFTGIVTCVSTASDATTSWAAGLTEFLSVSGTGSLVANLGPTIYQSYVVQAVKLSLNGPVNLTNGTLALDFTSGQYIQVTPTATGTFTTTPLTAGCMAYLIILTSGASSFTMTFGTGFKSQGTLATGTAGARRFVMQFISDGTSMLEVSRTSAMA